MGDSMKWSELSSKDKKRYLKFASGSTKASLISYRDRSDHPDKHRLPEVEIKPKKHMLNYLSQFKDGFVKDR